MMDLAKAKAAIDKHLRVEEGERLEAYLCPAGVPTIGVGATTYLDGRKVSLGDPPITREQMGRMLEVEIDRYCIRVLDMVERECTTNQLIALVLCSYNIGLDGMAGSSMIRAHKAGDYAAAARAFRLWNKYRPRRDAPLEVHPVLDARRAREAAIYVTPDVTEPTRAPQAVQPESSIASSPIAQAGTVTAGAGVVAVATQAGEHLGIVGGVLRQARDILVDSLGVPTEWLLPIAVIVTGVVVIRWRLRQRREAWA